MRVCEWRRALKHLDALEAPDLWGRTRLHVWRAKCYLRLSEPSKARELALSACDLTLERGPQLRDYARIVLVESMLQLGELPIAMRLLAKATQEAPDCWPLRQRLIDLVINVQGDWALASKLLQPLQGQPSPARMFEAFTVKEQLYTGSSSAQQLTTDIFRFADRHFFHHSGASSAVETKPLGFATASTHRPRLGLISPMFNASPVYFLCIGALRELAQDFDLVFFSRDCRSSWAVEDFKSIATEWRDVSFVSSAELASEIKGAQLDALIDLSGWLDLTVLQALAEKLAPTQVKWVGGQSTTTGLRSFDAYVSDIHQSPLETSKLHSEPVARMPGGYVTYTPPSYMPRPQAPSHASARSKVGVVAHPKKICRAFLAYLVQEIDLHNARDGQGVDLHFIGWQFGETALQRRLQTLLGLDENHTKGAVGVHFKASKSHLEQLSSIGETDWIVDTFPYTGGLTALEALALGVPYRTHAGSHSSARHAFSHAKFSGLEPPQFDLETLGAFRPGPLKKSGVTLLPEGCPRLDHTRLATDLARLIRNPSEFLSP